MTDALLFTALFTFLFAFGFFPELREFVMSRIEGRPYDTSDWN